MHGLRITRMLLPLLIVAVAVFGIVSVVSARPDLQDAKKHVNQTWTPVRDGLTARYVVLQSATDELEKMPGPVRELAGSVDTALTTWKTSANSSVASQVRAANNVEALARRMVTTARASDRVKSDANASPLIDAYAQNSSLGLVTLSNFNNAVARYDKERHGPVRGVVANMLGDDDIPALSPAAIT
jgi:hypothetical protein